MNIKKVTVFCGASKKCKEIYLEQAANLGKSLAKSGREIIYGGGNIGLMGHLADGALSEGGRVTGIIPNFLQDLELGHKGIAELREVDSLHIREEVMMTESDCIIALPGGIGTFSELLQAITWKRLWQINSKIIIVNTDNYFEPLISQLNKALEEQFLKNEFSNLWTVVYSDEEAMLELD
ncbi:MAG: TIGR00730 family Rossman fold protein [bacterium]